MNNVVAVRLLLALAIMMATLGAFLAFYFLKFPASAAVAALPVALGVGAVILFKRKEKAERFNVYYRTVQELGSPINFGGSEAAFEHDGTRFDVEFPQSKYKQFFKVNFRIPNVRQKFFIQNRSLAMRFHEDCEVIKESPLPPDYLVQARNPAFLLNFLGNRQIRDEIFNCQVSIWGGVMIMFDDGDFELLWTPPVSEQIEGFYQVSHSAAVFHDELKRISELPQ